MSIDLSGYWRLTVHPGKDPLAVPILAGTDLCSAAETQPAIWSASQAAQTVHCSGSEKIVSGEVWL